MFLRLYCGRERSISYNEFSFNNINYLLYVFAISANLKMKVLGRELNKHLLSCLYEGVFCLDHGLCVDFIFNQDKYTIRQVPRHLLICLEAPVLCT